MRETSRGSQRYKVSKFFIHEFRYEDQGPLRRPPLFKLCLVHHGAQMYMYERKWRNTEGKHVAKREHVYKILGRVGN